ncbi:head-tail adaptor protein [Clostridium botulinum]|nr:head-tail adaptor protein [Clostridium botulinum]NFO40909.1 head-tail adaptor protein [Clostridium botulinum]
MNNRFKIKSSHLKQIISIERLSSNRNDDGILVERYNEILNIRARVVNIDGNESDNNKGIQNKVQIEVYIRFNPLVEIKDSDRINFKNNYFNITYIDNLDNRNRWLKIKGVKIE